LVLFYNKISIKPDFQLWTFQGERSFALFCLSWK